MQKLIFLVLFFTFSFGCSGDCLSCHPKLQATILVDERHKPMLTCIKCHTSETGGVSECGKDCFSCHPIEKISSDVIEHAVIKKCADCHTKIPALNNLIQENSSQGTMKSLLFQ